MAATKTSTPKKARGAKTSHAGRRGGIEALDDLNISLDQAQKAATALRRDLSRGAGDLTKDIERLIKDARRDARKLDKSVRADLGQLQTALTPKRKAKPARKSPRTRRPASTAR